MFLLISALRGNRGTELWDSTEMHDGTPGFLRPLYWTLAPAFLLQYVFFEQVVGWQAVKGDNCSCRGGWRCCRPKRSTNPMLHPVLAATRAIARLKSGDKDPSMRRKDPTYKQDVELFVRPPPPSTRAAEGR